MTTLKSTDGRPLTRMIQAARPGCNPAREFPYIRVPNSGFSLPPPIDRAQPAPFLLLPHECGSADDPFSAMGARETLLLRRICRTPMVDFDSADPETRNGKFGIQHMVPATRKNTENRAQKFCALLHRFRKNRAWIVAEDMTIHRIPVARPRTVQCSNLPVRCGPATGPRLFLRQPERTPGDRRWFEYPGCRRD